MKTQELTFCKWCFDPKSDLNDPLTHIGAGDETWSQCPHCGCLEVDHISAVVDEDNMVVEVL